MKIKFILFVFFSIWMALLVRVFYLAVQSNDYYTRLSYNNTIKSESIAPVRGEIIDRNGVPIAINKLGFKIKLRPHLRSKKNIQIFEEEIAVLTKLFPDIDKKDIIKKYRKQDSYYNHDYITIIDFIPYKEMMPVYSMLNLRENVQIVPAPKRFYPYKNVAAHVVGYVSRANSRDIKNDPLADLIGFTGKTGLEKYYNGYLEGKAGETEIQVNANNQVIKKLSHKNADENHKLVLNLDIKLQQYIDSIFDKKAGAIIVMGVDGSILAASSYPTYDLNIFVSGMSYAMYNELSSSLEHPFTNKLINGLYPPGSSIKIGLGLLYITTDLNKHWKVYCKSSLPLGGRIFRCWKKKGHYSTDVVKAITESCDDYFYKGSLILGNEKMSEGLMRYGLGKKTDVDLPNEFIGVVPSRSWKLKKYGRSWNKGETLNMSIGQGDFLATPMQIAQFTALMATGKLPVPHFAHKIGDKEYNPQPREVFNDAELKELPTIQKAMTQVCNSPHGTATQYLSSNVKIAGKTGTAQVVAIKQDVKKRKSEYDMEYYSRSHAWFTTYGPYDDPQYIVLAMVEHGGHGGHAAGEIVSNIYNKLLELGYIKTEPNK